MSLMRMAEGIYSTLLHLFPVEFLAEFGEEMRSDFHQSMEENRRISWMASLAVFLRELRDLPINLLNTHLKRRPMLRILRSQLIRFAWRGALGFGLSFVLVDLIFGSLRDTFGMFQLNHVYVCLLKPYQPWCFLGDYLVAWTIASLVGSLVLALFFSDRAHFLKVMRLSFLCWCIPGLVLWSINHFLATYLWRTIAYDIWAKNFFTFLEILTGGFLGLALGKVFEIKKKKILLILVGAALCPIVYFLWDQLPVGWIYNYYRFLKPIYYYGFYAIDPVLILRSLFSGVIFGIIIGFLLGLGKQKSVVSGGQPTLQ